ncbi:glycosyl transferase family protein : Glycosyl transferase, family 39 OS=Solibacter usitatus (strain Ellin6076) GN=Acid_1421 PE=4 SV=1: PMT [Gemmata massiliana]|uniref:ArnT-like N-terminal domain-containing protein n=1 Tax=Gemmata massiliana TaxID=1210884 RepID=A0A6P2CUB7_9BACT|nr:phospholipid carrier-dependent glycosyltransferase [Gemmata massiliana]VTR92748.1 glycosyl transferase family protein : Glycosyl transferase, family 39 OS=Solibacter usitatus (strain Ellin6076) GN=Acid_1421 PE=4 SV=1: PMT [Gemmata massiliana]
MTRNRASILLTLAAVAGFVAWFWCRGEQFLAANGPTFDEPVHLAAGYSYWVTGSFRLNREDPPLLKMLWAAPLVFGEHPPYPYDVARETNNDHWHVGDAFFFHSDRPPRELLAPARRVNLALGVCVVLLTGWWAFRLWNSRLAGIGAAGFAVCDPNLLALSCVLSTDIGLTLFALLACYLVWEYVAAPSRGLLVGAGAALGLALGAKFSALAVVLGLGTAGAVFVLMGGRLALPNTPPDVSRGRALIEFAFRLGLIALVALAATYGFVHFDQWGSGLKFQLTRAAHGDGMMYLNGELSRTGWYHYFLALFPIKLPLGLFTGALLVVLTSRLVRAPRSAFLFVPAVVFFVLASYSRVDLGIRVVLPVLPFLYIVASGLASRACCHTAGGVLLALCLVWAGVSAARSDPHPIAYFNELAGGPRGGLRFVADSNVDWGQGLPALKAYLDAHGPEVIYLSYFGTDRPEAYGIRYQALPAYGRVGAPGGEFIPADAPRHVVVVSANNLLGIYLNDPDTFAWLRARAPTAILGGSLYVFDLTGDAAVVQHVRTISVK